MSRWGRDTFPSSTCSLQPNSSTKITMLKHIVVLPSGTISWKIRPAYLDLTHSCIALDEVDRRAAVWGQPICLIKLVVLEFFFCEDEDLPDVSSFFI
jgi:hypothetical protein